MMDDLNFGSGRPLYASHFLSAWNSRAFEFGAVLFLAAIYPGTLLPLSIYALLRAASAICFAGFVGRYIDNQGRLEVVRLSIIGQRLAVAISCGIFSFLLSMPESIGGTLHVVAFSLLAVLACIEKLASIMNAVAVERDWVVVLAQDDERVLQEMNSQMRRIDLFCKLAAPLAIALVDGWSSKVAVMATFVVNLASVCLEYPLVAWVFRKEPALATPKGPILEANSLDSSRSVLSSLTPELGALRIYCQSSAFLPSLSLAFLYLTVLSFSGQMIIFLLALPTPHLSSAGIGGLRTVSAAFEISATFLAPRVMSRIGPVRAGIWFLSWQTLCLTLAVGTLWSPSSTGSAFTISIFIVGVVFSRIGLWSFDLCAQLLIQESIEPQFRGSFSATEASLQNLFELCAFATTILFPRPGQFRYPALLSLLALCVAASLFAKYVRDRRGHLLHMPPCLKSHSYRPVETELEES